ncbi:MAG: hypothetical protein M2R45_01587 [Verrucomicrobia subdivision 3 bacterium]|nr:hypothetical protein [Limisphaerales bacterium]MCS1412740.1 hypothetical protein [Limisphaerales bacterium]
MNQQDCPAYHGNTGVLTTAGFHRRQTRFATLQPCRAAQHTLPGLLIYEVPAEIVEQTGLGVGALTCAGFLRCFSAYAAPRDAKAVRLAADAAAAKGNPHFLTYWHLEGGWCGYDMFNPVMTANNVHERLDRISGRALSRDSTICGSLMSRRRTNVR